MKQKSQNPESPTEIPRIKTGFLVLARCTNASAFVSCPPSLVGIKASELGFSEFFKLGL